MRKNKHWAEVLVRNSDCLEAPLGHLDEESSCETVKLKGCQTVRLSNSAVVDLGSCRNQRQLLMLRLANSVAVGLCSCRQALKLSSSAALQLGGGLGEEQGGAAAPALILLVLLAPVESAAANVCSCRARRFSKSATVELCSWR